MKPLATWNLIDDEVRWHSGAGRTKKGIWRVNMWARRGEEKVTREITPSEPVYLRELLKDVILNEIDSLLDELSGPDNMGFEVFKWR